MILVFDHTHRVLLAEVVAPSDGLLLCVPGRRQVEQVHVAAHVLQVQPTPLML